MTSGITEALPVAGTSPIQRVEAVAARAAEPGSADAMAGFQRALESEHDALRGAFEAAPPGTRERLTRLAADLYAVLRTPIFPKKGYLAFGEALLTTAAHHENRATLYGVLASTTAGVETSSFLQCAAIFKRHGIAPRLRLFLVRWENLVDIRQQDTIQRAHAFAHQVRRASDEARQAGFADAIIPIDVELDAASAEIVRPLDVREWSLRVMQAAQEPAHACPALVRDATWSRGFYARQTSLSRLGDHQALLDLAIRRAIGARLTQELATQPQGDQTVAALITSELHKRLLPCYAAPLPILNIDVRTCVQRTSQSA